MPNRKNTDKDDMKGALSKRRTVNYKRVADEARQKMNITRITKKLDKVSNDLESIADDAAKSQKGYTDAKSKAIKLRIDALGNMANIEFRKLAKVLPDMKWEALIEAASAETKDGELNVENAAEARDQLFDKLAKNLLPDGSSAGSKSTH